MTYKLIGENTLTGNSWECETGIQTREAAHALRANWKRLESDYKIDYRVEEEPADAHRTADMTPEELGREIDRAIVLGADGPRFCGAPYVGFATCARIGDHEGEHVTQALRGRLIAY